MLVYGMDGRAFGMPSSSDPPEQQEKDMNATLKDVAKYPNGVHFAFMALITPIAAVSVLIAAPFGFTVNFCTVEPYMFHCNEP